MADAPRPDDDATRIYRPYGSPPPEDSPDADPFATDPFATDPFATDPAATEASDPFAPQSSAASATPKPTPTDPFAADGPAEAPFAAGPSAAPTPPPPDPFAAHSDDPTDPFRPTPSPERFTNTPPAAPEPPAPAPASADASASVPPAPSHPPVASDPFGASPAVPSPPATPPPATPNPFAVPASAPFAPAPAPRGPEVPGHTPDPFAAAPSTGSDDPFADLHGPTAAGGGRGGAFDSGLHAASYHGGGAALDLPDAFGTEQTLAGAFTPVFSLILQIRSAAHLGDPTALRQRVEALLSESAQAARAAGADEADIEAATFCVIAFLDEAILGSEWPGRDAWSSQPLQLTHYDRYDAGEQFFDRLKAVLDAGGTRTALLEVYYLCLALGFKGRYAIQGREVLRRLVDDLHARISRASGTPGPLAPRGRSREVATQAEKGGLPTWAVWVAAAALVTLLYLGLSFSVSGVASEAADDLRAIPTPTLQAP